MLLAKVQGSLLGDIAGGSGMADEGVPEELTAEAEVHSFMLREVEEQFGNYEEKDAEVVKPRLGEGRKSEFTASTTLGGKVRGYRVTILGHDKCITVIAQCPEKHWDTLKPAFNKVIESLERGQVEI